MHDVVDEVRGWYDAGDRFALATVVGTWRSAPRQPGAAMAVSASTASRRQRVRRLRRGCGLRAGAGGDGQRRAGPAALRRQRRRRVRRRPDLRRHHRRLRRAGRRGRPSPAAGTWWRRCAPTSRSRWRPWSTGRATSVRIWSSGRDRSAGGARARSGSTTRSPTTYAACSTTARPGCCRIGPDGERRQDELTRLRAVLRPAAADAGLRRDRLRRRGGAGRQVPRLPRDGVRRAAGLRDRPSGSPRPTRSSSSGRTATSQPTDGRRAYGDLRAHPRPEVRRAAARGGAADRRGLHRRDGQPPHARGPAGPAARGGRRPRTSWPGCARRSGWTSARARRRRPRCRSPPRSWRTAGAAAAAAALRPSTAGADPPCAPGA